MRNEKSDFLFIYISKGQLSYVEGGLAYIQVADRTSLIPARHYFWMPAGINHNLTTADSATHLRSLFFYTHDDHKNEFYTKIGIYPMNELFIHSQKWAGHVTENEEKYLFLKVIKDLLPEISTRILPMALDDSAAGTWAFCGEKQYIRHINGKQAH